MAQLIMAESATPSTPSTGKASLYITTAGRLALKDDAGVELPGGVFLSGAWTPIILGSTTPGAHTYTSQTGRYVRIDRLVIAWFDVRINTKDGAMAGNARIGGLPFIVASGVTASGTISVWLSLATSVVSVTIDTAAGTTEAQLRRAVAATVGNAAMPAGDIASGTILFGTLIYETSA